MCGPSDKQNGRAQFAYSRFRIIFPVRTRYPLVWRVRRMDLFAYIGEQIRRFRGARGLSQEVLGRQMGVPTNTISRWETATYRPDVAQLDRLARLLGKSILDFFPD